MTIENLEKLVQLRCLFLQQNLICRIENLSKLTNLVTLDLSRNMITKVEGLDELVKLRTLNLSKNALSSAASVEELSSCPTIRALDLSNNDLESRQVLNTLRQLPELATLYLRGNVVTQTLRNYRKTVLAENEKLSFLDDRPVSKLERRCANAWKFGGLSEEKLAYAEHKAEEQVRLKKHLVDWKRFKEAESHLPGNQVKKGNQNLAAPVFVSYASSRNKAKNSTRAINQEMDGCDPPVPPKPASKLTCEIAGQKYSPDSDEGGGEYRKNSQDLPPLCETKIEEQAEDVTEAPLFASIDGSTGPAVDEIGPVGKRMACLRVNQPEVLPSVEDSDARDIEEDRPIFREELLRRYKLSSISS